MKDDPELTTIENEIERIESTMRLIFSLLLIALLLGALSLVGRMSKTDNDMAESFYCQSVHDGLQNDYNGTYKQGKCPQSSEKAK